MLSRRAGSHRSDDDDRVRYGPCQYFGMTIEPHLGVEAVAQNVVELLLGGEASHIVEARFGPERIEQRIERSFEPAVAKVLEARRRDSPFEKVRAIQPGRRDGANFSADPDACIQQTDERGTPRRLDRRLGQNSHLFFGVCRYRTIPLAMPAVPALPQPPGKGNAGTAGIAKCIVRYRQTPNNRWLF